MEGINKIIKWVSGYGSGYGYGDGDGSGDGSGYGDGDGSGDGSGYGDGDGSGDGYGDVYGEGSIKIIKVNNEEIFYIDFIPTIISKIRGNVAKGFIVSELDFSLKPCYIAKVNNSFAHEETLEGAVESARKKYFSNLNIEDKIKEFVKTFDKNKAYKGKDFFEWHNVLTGSCLIGRQNFIDSKGYSLDEEYSVQEFISACENSFGGATIKKLKPYYEK